MAQITEPAWLLKSEISGEHFLRLSLFCQTQGLVRALKRIHKKKEDNESLDFFDRGIIYLEKSKQGGGWFFKSFDLERRHIELGKNYKRMEAAALFSNFLLKNLIHLESYDFAWDLTEQFLQAIIDKPNPKIASFKAFYLFGKEEGYPVKEDWLPRLITEERKTALHLIQTPLDQISISEDAVNKILESLFTYFNSATDIIA